jgi:hypothetical protein
VEFWDAIHLAALRDVYFARKDRDGGDPLYTYRKIFRWYSRTFSTPLHQVEELPLEDVLRAWYEETLEDLDEKDLEDKVREAALPAEERLRRARVEDAFAAEEYDALREAEAENAAAERALLAKKVEDVVRPIQQDLRALRMSKKDVDLVPESKVVVPPDIKMTFVDDDDDSFERQLEGDSFGLLDPPSKAK